MTAKLKTPEPSLAGLVSGQAEPARAPAPFPEADPGRGFYVRRTISILRSSGVRQASPSTARTRRGRFHAGARELPGLPFHVDPVRLLRADDALRHRRANVDRLA